MSKEIEGDDISFNDLMRRGLVYLRYLKAKWFSILVLGFIGAFIGFIYSIQQPIKYNAKITFVLEEGKTGSNSFGGLASLAGQFGVDVGGSSGGGLLSGDNILLFFKSESLAREVLLSKFDSGSNKSIADVYLEVYKLKSKWEKSLKVANISFPPHLSNKLLTRFQDSLLQIVVKNILKNEFSVSKTDKKAGFIEVNTTMENEILTKFYCERIVTAAVNRYLSIKTLRQKQTIDKLQKRVDSIANLLNSKTSSAASLQTSVTTMDINPLYKTDNLVAVESTIRDKTMLATIFASVTQNLEVAKFTLSQETPVIQIVDSSNFPLAVTKTSKLVASIQFSFLFMILFSLYILFKRSISLK